MIRTLEKDVLFDIDFYDGYTKHFTNGTIEFSRLVKPTG